MANPTVAIIDYKSGNVRSVSKALEKYGALAVITSDIDVISSADAVVFPGQGACDTAMRNLNATGLAGSVKEAIASGKPFLGICLGLQLLLDVSDEGDEQCLGVLAGRVRKFPQGLKIPHMGWNQVQFHLQHPVLDGLEDGSHFYFVHSYYADPEDAGVVAGTTIYGTKFCSAVAWDNAVGVQFHPEKSGVIGLKLYENFVEYIESSKMKS